MPTNDKQLIQDAANMGVLARQAIGNQFPTMAVDPKICANVALLVERLTRTTDEDPAIPVPMQRVWAENAKEEGRREVIGEFAQEKADLLQRIVELEAALPEGHELRPLAAPVDDLAGQTLIPGMEHETPGEGNDFKGPGQR